MEQSLRIKLSEMGKRAKSSARSLARLTSHEKNEILKEIKASLLKHREEIIKANEKDLAHGREIGLSEGLMDRLMLDDKRVEAMAHSIDEVIHLKDPVGKITEMNINDDGLQIGKKTVPIGVIAIIYEARPNVTLDAAILSLKASSAIILRGGKEAIHSNIAITKAMREALVQCNQDPDTIQIIEDTSRESAKELMQLKGYVDLLVPRGSASLIQTVVDQAKVPVLETGVGNCHIYIDESAKIEMALPIIENAKTQRVGVCNAMETLLVHKNVGDEFYKKLNAIIDYYDIRVYGCEKTKEKLPGIQAAGKEEYEKEFLDYAFAMKIVEDFDEAIDHIYRYSSAHSEVIVTENYENAMRFLDEVDSACVYVNASSRFTDGFVFGFGAELGISTQKLHARGPVGLSELVSTKYIILGHGQVRK
ncbi:MAG: glutamate-5-semialdehyde dehydrogenase [Tissierellia bacterium]|nr:glutamate-5-semialdehyde dehydrogenase [Tissierellia bacterium]